MKSFLSIVLAFFLLADRQAIAAEKTIIIGSDPWCPYQCFDGNESSGITLDIMKKVFEPLGYKVVLVNTPWARAIISLRNGEITTFGSAAKADAPDMIWAAEPTTIMRNTIFKLKSDPWKYQTIDSLKDGILGVISSYTYGAEIDKYIKDNPSRVDATTGAAALESNVRKLLKNRVRFFIDDNIIVGYTISKMQVSEQIEAVHRSSEVPLYFGFSPQNPDAAKFAELTSRMLIKMKADGSLARLFANYGVTIP
jgi:polar amino acid transport system substrate-binding protein